MGFETLVQAHSITNQCPIELFVSSEPNRADQLTCQGEARLGCGSRFNREAWLFCPFQLSQSEFVSIRVLTIWLV